MSEENKRPNLSIKNLLTIVFISFMLIAITSYGAVVFSNWFNSVEETVETLAADTHENVVDQVQSFLHIPYHVNEMNHRIIENNILDMSDAHQRERFFAGALLSHPEVIYSFSYGTANGEYYGARRNESGEVEIMLNNQNTSGQSWYYKINDDLTAGELAVKLGEFDPRTRDWYIAAAEKEAPVYSPVYTHFAMQDLTVSAAWPIYDEAGLLDGVMGAHFLLSDINGYLENAINRYDGQAIIFEKGTEYLIANSMRQSNFETEQDNGLTRKELGSLDDMDLIGAYRQYEEDQIKKFAFSGETGTLQINIDEIAIDGVDWLLLSAVPQSFFMATITASMTRASGLAVFTLILLIIAYIVLLRRLTRPLSVLLSAASAFRDGDLSQRVKIKRRDEVGLISESFNQVAAKMQDLIENLEDNVAARTSEFQNTNLKLDESRSELRLILDTAEEAVYGIDTQGRCTFCNDSGIKMLGYNSENDLIGKDMHKQIHHTKKNGSPFPLEECRISQSIKQGRGFTADDEVFWRADGTSFDVEYHAKPKIKDGIVDGGVITFVDITDKKKKEEEILYLNQHDVLTGLHNRRYFEKILVSIEDEKNLPLSIIFVDINGLKITNDIFGHETGDVLIKKAAEILSHACRDKDIIARIGGDEFVILLPNTTKENAQRIVDRIRKEFSDAQVDAIKCSVAIGLETKYDLNQSMEEIMANAENHMYKDKTLNRKQVNKEIVDTLIAKLHEQNPRERQHSIEVEALCGWIGKRLGLPESEIETLRRAAFLHDIGKITLERELLTNDSLTDDEEEHIQIQQHSLTGYRLLSLIDDTMDLAKYVYHHHEHWDGTGFPKGLVGKQIPLISRIIAIAETYERIINRTASLQVYSLPERKQRAITAIRDGSDSRFDPKIAELFVNMIIEKYQ